MAEISGREAACHVPLLLSLFAGTVFVLAILFLALAANYGFGQIG